MPEQKGLTEVTTAARLRAATKEVHARLERRLDAIDGFTDPTSRAELIRRFAALHAPAASKLAPYLRDLPGLDFDKRSRASLFRCTGPSEASATFPQPRSTAEALGMMYVLEGSTLGGRFILQALVGRGVD